MFNEKEIEKLFELAFGDEAIKKGYTTQEVIERLEDFTEKSHKYENLMQGQQISDDSSISCICSKEDIDSKVTEAGLVYRDNDSRDEVFDIISEKMSDYLMTGDFWTAIECGIDLVKDREPDCFRAICIHCKTKLELDHTVHNDDYEYCCENCYEKEEAIKK